MIPFVFAEDLVDDGANAREVDLSVLTVFEIRKRFLVAHRVLLTFRRIFEGEDSDLYYYRENDDMRFSRGFAYGIVEILQQSNYVHAAVKLHQNAESQQFHVVEKETANGESRFEFYVVLRLTESDDYGIGDAKQAKRLYDYVVNECRAFVVW